MRTPIIDSSKSRENNFQLFRFVFAVLVLLAHSFELLDGNRSREPLTALFGTISFGELAVDGFFLLSGYLVLKSWCDKPDAKIYLTKRILRILPGFIASYCICLLLIAPLGAVSDDYFSRINIVRATIDALRLEAPSPPPFKLGVHSEAINGSMWSISFEFRCYIYVAILGLLGLPKRKILWLIAACTFIFIYFAMGVCKQLDLKPAILGRYPLTNPLNFIHVRLGMFFFMGGVFFLYKDKIYMHRRYAASALIVLAAGMFHPLTAEPAIATAGAYALFYTVFLPIRPLRFIQNLPDVSYGVYLYGWPIQLVVLWKFPEWDAVAVFVVSTVLSIVAGTLSWYGVEKPALRIGRTQSKA